MTVTANDLNFFASVCLSEHLTRTVELNLLILEFVNYLKIKKKKHLYLKIIFFTLADQQGELQHAHLKSRGRSCF